jgi:hypothetical protein
MEGVLELIPVPNKVQGWSIIFSKEEECQAAH